MIVRCGQCGETFEFRARGEQPCPHCGVRVKLPEPVAATPAEPLPWEQRHELGSFRAYFKTAFRILTAPGDTYSRVSRLEDDPAQFAWMTWGLMAAGATFLTFLAVVTPVIVKDQELQPVSVFLVMAFAVAVPLLGMAQMGIRALLLHGTARLFGADRQGFSGTFAAAAYAEVPHLLLWLPLVGQLAFFWQVALTVVGLRRIHGISLGQALGVVLVPLAVALVLVLGLLALL